MGGRRFAVFVSLFLLFPSDQTLTSINLDHKLTKCTARLTTTLSLARILVSRDASCANAFPSIALNAVMVRHCARRAGHGRSHRHMSL